MKWIGGGWNSGELRAIFCDPSGSVKRYPLESHLFSEFPKFFKFS